MEVKAWQCSTPNPEAAALLQQETCLPCMLCDILAARGYTSPQAVRALVEETPLHGPHQMQDMPKAVERIRVALGQGERIAIYGDYDCDGITATAMLYAYLEASGADLLYYIPDRETEGYGLNITALQRMQQEGVNLIITVDNGNAAVKEVEAANQMGLDVIITDHHKPGEQLPAALAVLNPHRQDESYPFVHLAGVGVAFKLICALEEDDGLALLEEYGDLVAMGTIADIVPLTDENRTIVRIGLQKIAQTDNTGIAALLQATGLEGKPLTAQGVAFGLAPRINAAGRIGSPDEALELLLCDDPQRAQQLAQRIDGQNADRRSQEATVLADIEALLARQPELLRQRLLIFCGQGWHNGLLGIAAARMVERYGKPCLLLSNDGTLVRGSGRSVEGYNMISAITACGQHLLRYGGHNQAAGLTLAQENLQAFVASLQEHAAQNYNIMPVHRLKIDRALEIAEATCENAATLRLLEPCGHGCPSPLFALFGCRLEAINPISQGKHLRLRLGKNGQSLWVVCFGQTPENFPFVQGDLLDVALTLGTSLWNEQEVVSLRAVDIRLAGVDWENLHLQKQYYEMFCRGEVLPEEVTAVLEPSRQELALVYRYLQQTAMPLPGCDMLYGRLYGKGIGYLKLRLIIDILIELEVVAQTPALRILKRDTKAELAASGVLQKIQAAKLVK